ncbi:glycoside hydrolase family 97 protein [Mucilaginibacter lacusdianchii]|uniref:glycoside hydrolase family 97 protein n=1 Tax=Mucilaginibacter lacusdianchii TaxID=2684211 RepID=UPI00131D8AEE|nr:glycoside hydrolase family 97 protein [Mucilaginibacter sp. JXJ CY 39]
MRKLFLTLLFILTCSIYSNAQVLTSPDKKLALTFSLNTNGEPTYKLAYQQKDVVKTSKLGIETQNVPSFNQGFTLAKSETSTFDETWNPVWGEQKSIRNHYNELLVTLSQKSVQGRLMRIRFRLFNDGLGFRYEFPVQQDLTYFTVTSEDTEFQLTGDHKAFWIPGDYDSNEYLYTTSKLSEADGWKQPLISNGTNQENRPDRRAVQTPLMLKTQDGLYINIHEAALINYPAMQLHVDPSNHLLTADLVPDVKNNKAYLRTPNHTPWRTVIVSNKATDILSSTLILNLNEPTTINNTSWIKPMKFMGVWWEMQIGHSSWSYADNEDAKDAKGGLIPHGHHGANTANVKRYIDFASQQGIQGLLVEGWNTGWEEWGAEKEDKFSMVTPYPDFDINEITRYAKAKGVMMIMHNETGGGATSYERQMDTAFRFMNKYGYTSVKTGYVGRIVPRGEHHDGQWMVNHYIRAAEKAAQYHVAIDMHEPVRPTGLQRTYPNFMASEAGRGNEWNAFSAGSPPEHETILPFTRLMGGPMDYTPGIFKLTKYAKGDSLRHMHTTLAKQLALYVTMYSPLQMVADLPENYQAYPDAFQFIKDVAVDWDNSYVLEAEPGDYLTIARKAKDKNEWYVGSITDEMARTAVVKFDYLPKGKTFEATIYADGEDASYDKNPQSYAIRKIKVTSKTVLKQQVASGGGFAISVK